MPQPYVREKIYAPAQLKSSEKLPLLMRFLGGIGFTFLIALLGLGLSKITGFDRIGPLACSIVIAVIFRQIWDYPEKLRAGIEFSSKKLLRYAIVLYGLKLNIMVIFNQGMPLMLRDVGTIVFSILITLLLAKWIKADFSISLLLGVGTGVCGAAAIAAVSPIIQTKEEDTAIGVGIIALIGTVFAVLYTVLHPYLPITDINYGIWSGVSLHEIAHVALAAAPGGEDVLAIAILAKLGRVFLLVPLCFIIIYWMNKRKPNQADKTKIDFPWFLIGFIGMSLFGSYIVGKYVHISAEVMGQIGNFTTHILTMAMVGLGLNVSFQALKTKALRPLIAMVITSILLSVLTFFSIF